jgi:hypothetical protein
MESSLMVVSILKASLAGKTLFCLIKKSEAFELEYKFKDRSIIAINFIIECKE